MDLLSLQRATELANQKNWFPPTHYDQKLSQWVVKYPESSQDTLALRQTLCKNFIFGPLRTTDAQERKTNPVKPVPRIPYLEVWIDGLVREPDVIGAKIRRMIQTLTCEGYLEWRVAERPGTYIAVVHAALEDGQRHVEEDIKGVMWEQLPLSFREQFVVAEAKGQLRLTHRYCLETGNPYPWDSWIVPYPTGARALRSFGHAVIFWDEFSTHPGAEKAFRGIMATRVGQTLDIGQLILLGTVNPDTASGRYFKKLYETENFRRARMVARYGAEIMGVQ